MSCVDFVVCENERDTLRRSSFFYCVLKGLRSSCENKSSQREFQWAEARLVKLQFKKEIHVSG